MRPRTNREIKWALRTHMPNLDWRFRRVPPGEPKSAYLAEDGETIEIA